jgi:hypothetical protein
MNLRQRVAVALLASAMVVALGCRTDKASVAARVRIAAEPSRAPVGWNLQVSVAGQDDELIRHVTVLVNDQPVFDKSLSPPTNDWKMDFRNVGVYPGDNRAVITAHNQQGHTRIATRQW